jgi:hypothetical protein
MNSGTSDSHTSAYWFLMRAAGHLTPQPCSGHIYDGTCPKCKAQEILMNAAMRLPRDLEIGALAS